MFIAEKGYDVQYGARPIKRAIQKYLEDEMAEIIIQDSVKSGDTVVVDYDADSDSVKTRVEHAG